MPEYDDPELRSRLAALDGDPHAEWVDAQRARLAAAWESGTIESEVTPVELTTITQRASSASTRPGRHRLFAGVVAAAVLAAVAVGMGLARNHAPSQIKLGASGAASCPGKAYVTNFGGTVSVITTATGVVSATIPVGNNPRGVAITPDGKHVYVANQGSGTVSDGWVSVITTATGAVSPKITVGYRPAFIAITPDGTHAYVTGLGDTVSVITIATRAVSAPIAVGSRPALVAISPDGKYAYVINNEDGTVSVITTATGAASAPIVVGKHPFGLAICPAERA